MVERPNWNFDNSGNAVVPAAPSSAVILREMETQSGPSPETAKAILGDEANVSPSVPAKL